LKVLKTILLILIFTSFGCNSEPKLNGNYSTCHNGLYAELYIENDSIQSATSMDWISNKRKFEIKNDTLYHLYFGEFSDSTKAKINYIDKDKFELYYTDDSVTHTLIKITDNIDWITDYEKFWNEFYERRKELDCYAVTDKYDKLMDYFGSENIRIDYTGESFKKVRLTHIPTGNVEFGNEYETQIENAILAFEKLKSKLKK
jgi:hypothetical protein